MGCLGPRWRRLGPFWGHLGVVLGRLGLSWGRLGLSWAVLGPSWAVLGRVWGLFGGLRVASTQTPEDMMSVSRMKGKPKEEGTRRTREGPGQTANERSKDTNHTREQSSNARQSTVSSTGNPQHSKTSKHASSKASRGKQAKQEQSALRHFRHMDSLRRRLFEQIESWPQHPKGLKPQPLKCLGGDLRSANNPAALQLAWRQGPC